MEEIQNGTEFNSASNDKAVLKSLSFDKEEGGFSPVIAPANNNFQTVKKEEEIPVGKLREEIPVGKLREIPTGKLINDQNIYGTVPPPTAHPVNLSAKGSSPSISNNRNAKNKGKKSSKEEIYKNPKGRLIVLLIGFILSVVAVVAAIAPLLMLFVPGWATLKGDMSLLEVAKPLNIVALVSGFVGIVFGVAGANTNKFLARLDFLFGIIAFFLGIVMLLFIIPITGLVG